MIESLVVCREEKIDKKIYEMQIKMRIGDDLTESKYFAKKHKIWKKIKDLHPT